MTRRLKVQLVALFGICVAAYAWNVENQLDDPFYEPACSGIFGGNCGKVRRKPKARPAVPSRVLCCLQPSGSAARCSCRGARTRLDC